MKIDIAVTTRHLPGRRDPRHTTKHFYTIITIDGITLETECVGPDIALKTAYRLAKSFGLEPQDVREIP